MADLQLAFSVVQSVFSFRGEVAVIFMRASPLAKAQPV